MEDTQMKRKSLYKTTTYLTDEVAARIKSALNDGTYVIDYVATDGHGWNKAVKETVSLTTECGLKITVEGHCQ